MSVTHKRVCRPKGVVVLAGLVAGFAGEVTRAQPVPLGTSTTTISYQVPGDTGPVWVNFSGDRNFNGVGPTDATVLAGADNIKIFNSWNQFGRRAIVPGALRPGESLITHAFYKTDNGGAYFPDLIQGGQIRLQFDNIHFDRPVTVNENTMMLHALWNADQVDQLDWFYISLQNHHTASFAFRDMDAFYGAGVFNQFPVPTVALGDINPTITGNGTDTIGIDLTFPYDMLMNFEENGQTLPPGLPGPQGFLESFHFHLEYIVTPEPGSLALLLTGTLLAVRRRRR